jgi:hypothetical protein
MNQLPESHYLSLEQDSLPGSWSISDLNLFDQPWDLLGALELGFGSCSAESDKEAELLSV